MPRAKSNKKYLTLYIDGDLIEQVKKVVNEQHDGNLSGTLEDVLRQFVDNHSGSLTLQDELKLLSARLAKLSA